MRGARLVLISLLVVGCGAKTGLEVQGSPRDAGGFDATFDAAPLFDAGPDVPLADTGLDAPPDAAPDAPDAFIPCPDPRSVAPSESSIPVDIIWVFDSSGSMIDENSRLQENIQIFWDAIVEADVDSRVIFIAERGYVPGPPPAFGGRFLTIDDEVGSWDPLLKILENYPMYRRFMRPDSIVHIVAVTDDDSRAIEWESFDAEFRSLLGRDYTAHAVASEQVMLTVTNPLGVCFTDDNAAWRPGFEYMGLTAATGGLFLSVCEEDWSRVIEPLSERVAVRIPLPCAYSLPQPPPRGIPYDPITFTVSVNFADGTRRVLPQVGSSAECGEGWSFVPVADRIELCPSTCAETDAADGRVTIDICAPSTVD